MVSQWLVRSQNFCVVLSSILCSLLKNGHIGYQDTPHKSSDIRLHKEHYVYTYMYYVLQISGICSCQTRISKIISKLEVSLKILELKRLTHVYLFPLIFSKYIIIINNKSFFKEFLIFLNIYYLISLNIF